MTEPSNPVTAREKLLAARAAGSPLAAFAGRRGEEREDAIEALAALHNEGALDALALFASDRLDDSAPEIGFWTAQGIFCKVLPKIEAPTEAVVNTCNALYDKAGSDGAAGQVYMAFRDWLRKEPRRAGDALAAIHRAGAGRHGVVRETLRAGAETDLGRFAPAALELSRHSERDTRLAALDALGWMEPERDSDVLASVVERFREAVAAPAMDLEAGKAALGVLRLLERIGPEFATAAESLIVEACRNPDPLARHCIADGLAAWRQHLTDGMIDAMCAAVATADRSAPGTIDVIDRALASWDLDRDRERAFGLLRALLTNGDDPIEIEALDSLRAELARRPPLAGWYAVSLLLTGEPRLCEAAADLLGRGREDSIQGLDIDLASFGLNGAWILYLARKIVAYFISNSSAGTPLLLSCLRAVTNDTRKELETLLFNFWAMNYSSAIDWMKENTSAGDTARGSVEALSAEMETYIETIKQCEPCAAFAPSEQARSIQRGRYRELGEKVRKEAFKRSDFMKIARLQHLLYGSGSISYPGPSESEQKTRQVTMMGEIETTFELPRLDSLDRVGLAYTLYRFRSEAAPE